MKQPTPKDFQDAIDDDIKWDYLKKVAVELFPDRIFFGTHSSLCDCCNKVHQNRILTLRDRRASE